MNLFNILSKSIDNFLIHKIQTPNDIIQNAIALTGIHPAGEAMPADYVTEGLRIFNDILDEWSGFGAFVPYATELQLELSPNKSQYTISQQLPADIQASPLIELDYAYIEDEEHNCPLAIITEPEYQSLVHSKCKQRPDKILLRQAPLQSELIFYPVPDKAYQVTLRGKQALANVELYQQLRELPPYYRRTLTYQIALDFAAIYGIELNPLIENRAEKCVVNLLAANKSDFSLHIAQEF